MSTRVAPGARDQVGRLLTLVPFLQTRDQVSLAEAAELLGSTPEEVLSDLRVLFMCGLPGGLPDDLIDVDLDAIESEAGTPRAEGVIRIGNADYLARPLRLSPTEASAVVVALHTLRDGSPADVRAIVDRVLAKLDRASAGRPPVAATHPAEAAQVALAARLQQASDDGCRVRLRYHVPARDEISEREVDPFGVVTSGRFSYLDAWCHSAVGDRLFRLDRIEEAEVLDRPVSRRRVPRDLVEGPFDESPERGTVVAIRLAPQAGWAVDYYPMREVRQLSDGVIEAELLVADPRWLIRLLLRLAPHAEVVAPEGFAEDLAVHARETLALYSPGGA